MKYSSQTYTLGLTLPGQGENPEWIVRAFTQRSPRFPAASPSDPPAGTLSPAHFHEKASYVKAEAAVGPLVGKEQPGGGEGRSYRGGKAGV